MKIRLIVLAFAWMVSAQASEGRTTHVAVCGERLKEWTESVGAGI